MLGFAKKCPVCKIKVERGIDAEVLEWGKVGIFKKRFCSEPHLDVYVKRTAALMKTRRVCISCQFR